MHLFALEEFVKYFFALDKLNYAKMTPIYLTEMSQLERTYPEIWSVFSNGNWVVNKKHQPLLRYMTRSCFGTNQQIDESYWWRPCWHTLYENARNRSFLISADLVRLTEEAKEMTRDSEAARKCHHELSQAILKRQTKNAQKHVNSIEGFVNPFGYQYNVIITLVTKAVMLEKIKQDICLIEEVGVANV